jgi:hypothetical protein
VGRSGFIADYAMLFMVAVSTDVLHSLAYVIAGKEILA